MRYPAIDVVGVDSELALVAVDDCSPTAVESHAAGFTVFFADQRAREAARAALASAFPRAAIVPRDVDDEDWARRSQEGLQSVSVGRITVFPSVAEWSMAQAARQPIDSSIAILIPPSTGFGTGHHATTRLCLAALQTIDLSGLDILDLGTGSGILAIAASRLGARTVLGIDSDADAIRAARENLAWNPAAAKVQLEHVELERAHLPRVDVLIANLTGAFLVRAADTLLRALKPGGRLILSGFVTAESDPVLGAFASATTLLSRTEEANWIALLLVMPGVGVRHPSDPEKRTLGKGHWSRLSPNP